MNPHRVAITGCVFGLAFGLAAPELRAAGPAAQVNVSGGVLAVQPLVDSDGASVRISGPDGAVIARVFGRSESPVVELAGADGAQLPDGVYVYEVVLHRRLAARDAAALREAQDIGAMPLYRPEPLVVSGSFRLQSGAVVQGGVEAPAAAERAKDASDAPGPGPQPDDFVINDDLIVIGSACIGLDCVNGESFGFDTLRLKENNTRIRFFDTSNSASFPTNDWQLTANDSANGGLEKFSIDDIDGGRTPFTIEAGAPSHSLYVDDGGRLGLGTSTPVVDIHAVSGNTPTLRLEQNGSSGFTPQTWDVAGNEANFFIRDVTNGSKLSLRIRPGAPQSSIDISSTGNVGITNGAPTAALHVLRSDGTAQVRVQENNGTNTTRTLLNLTNNGGPARWTFSNGLTATTWAVDNDSSGFFAVNLIDGDGAEMFLEGNGNMTIAGTLTQNSDRDTKHDIAVVDPQAVLAKVRELPISTWRMKNDAAQAVHMGPMAQDFAAAFGLGADERHIAPVDMSGVALAAIQALNAAVASKDAQIRALEERLAKLEAALAQTQP